MKLAKTKNNLTFIMENAIKIKIFLLFIIKPIDSKKLFCLKLLIYKLNLFYE